MYQIRGESYLEMGEKEKAKIEFEKALMYNKYYESAKQSLTQI